MVHSVKLFIDGIHFGIAIMCSDGWYKFQYAAEGTKMGSDKNSKDVTIKRSAPTGKVYDIGQTKSSLAEIIDYARKHCGFHGTTYDLFVNNCRKFCRSLADFMGVSVNYQKIIMQFGYLCA